MFDRCVKAEKNSAVIKLSSRAQNGHVVWPSLGGTQSCLTDSVCAVANER